MAFRLAVVLLVVIDSSQIDTRGSVFGVDFEDALVGFQGLLLARRIFLHSYCSDEELCRSLRDARLCSARLDDLRPVKGEQELPSKRIELSSLVTKCQPRSARKYACLQQRIFHAGNLPLHRVQRSTNHRRTNFVGAKLV